MEHIKTELESKDVKPTFQRMAVMNYLLENKVHPTVDMIHRSLVSQIPTISKTTVYNTLETLLESGLVKMVLISPTEIRYDAETKDHHHFFCKKCGKIEDVCIECKNAKKAQVSGNTVEEVHGYFKGICASCLKKQK